MFWWALAGGALLWAAFPPLDLWPLAWAAPVPWIMLCRRHALGPHAYKQIYLAGLVHWLAVIHWVRLPHWSCYFGWLALAMYLAIYLPLFVSVTRSIVLKSGGPLLAVAPIVWCALELVRGHAFSGFAMALLGHTQAAWLPLIQIADVVGAYGVGFLVVLMAASVVETLPTRDTSASWWKLAVALGAVGCAVGYGYWRLADLEIPSAGGRPLRVALIQGSIDTTFDEQQDPFDPIRQYLRLSEQAIADDPEIDLIVWPESMYSHHWIDYVEPIAFDDAAAPEMTVDEFRTRIRTLAAESRQGARSLSQQMSSALLVGSPRLEFGPQPMRRYNSALWIKSDGELAGQYSKMHPVMFGEYIPLGNRFPWLYKLSPMGNGLTAGTEPLPISMGDLILSPCICFENTVPHLIRRQVRKLAAAGNSPDVLVTITNDGWFWGSSLLDLHLVCGLFRAVELRRPMLISANTGFSAWIEDTGVIRSQGPRRAHGVVRAELVKRIRDTSLYEAWGDWFAILCLVICVWGMCWRFKTKVPAG